MFYNPQLTVDRIDAQIAELTKLKSQVPNVQPITQNFQLAPQNVIRYANSIDEVNKEYVIGDTPFFTKDLSMPRRLCPYVKRRSTKPRRSRND